MFPCRWKVELNRFAWKFYTIFVQHKFPWQVNTLLFTESIPRGININMYVASYCTKFSQSLGRRKDDKRNYCRSSAFVVSIFQAGCGTPTNKTRKRGRTRRSSPARKLTRTKEPVYEITCLSTFCTFYVYTFY